MVLCAFDGTWNKDEEIEVKKRTNVVRFRDLYESATKPIYYPGPGNSLTSNEKGLLRLFNKYAGGAVAGEAGIIIRRVYRNLCLNYSEEDEEIDIIGFSRGAAIALSFLWYMQRHGLRVAGSNTPITPKIRFVGLFDTVFFLMADLALPQVEQIKVRAIRYPFLRALTGNPDLSYPPISSRPFHALSLHDRRWAYYPARISQAHEVWFAGFHRDVG
ncbi:MAG: DUF2235 domain-containing protein [Pseudomonadota bacterium]